MKFRPLAERFWEKVDKRGPDECWLWTASFKSGSYGSIRIGRRAVRAHRVSYELANGPIPEGDGAHGTCVLHRCDTPSCVNPAHLFLGSQADNIHDCESKSRGNHPKGESVGTVRLSDHAVVALRCLRLVGGHTHHELSRLIDCSPAQVSNILSGKARRSANEWPCAR